MGASKKKRKNQYDYDEPILPQLDEKQLTFLEYYTKGVPVKEAMEKAGYASSYIRQKHTNFLETRIIQLALIELQSDSQVTTIKAQNEAIKQFWLNVMNNKDGRCKMSDRIKASENLARVNGLFVNKVEITGNVEHNLNNNQQSYEALSTEQLLKLIEATEDKEEENKIEEVEFEEIDKEEEEETNIFVKEND